MQHGLEHPVLLGQSMGGVLSLIAAASGRLQPRAVINLDGSLPAAEKTLAGQELIRSWLGEPDFRKRLARFLRTAFSQPPERDTRWEAILQTRRSAPNAVLRFLPEQINGLHPDRILPKLTAAILFIGSEALRFGSQKAMALFPQLRLQQIPNTGHFLQVYAVNQAAAIVLNFLKPILRF